MTMAYNFPASPTLDQVYAPSGGPSWTWNGFGWALTGGGEATEGPPGPAGPAGADGEDGADGATGPAGPAGSADTAAQVLAKLITVDGAGSGLDADLLDGQSSAAFAAASHTHAQADVTNLTTDITAAKARANHTGTQTASTISDFSTAADARITAAIGVSVQAYDADLTSWSAIAPSAKADVASPSLTGTPLSTTAASTVNTTQIATTAFVKSNLAVKVTVATSAPGSPATNDVWIDTT
jgi:hypothetical protein